MFRLDTHRWTAGLALVLLLIGQVVSIAHASEAAHDHQERSCMLCVASLADEPDIPSATDTALFPRFAAGDAHFIKVAPRAISLGCAVTPPATGPPKA